MEEQLGPYVSSSPLLEVTQKRPVQDEADLPALEAIQLLLDERIEWYNSIQSLRLGDSEFKIKQQVAVNQTIVNHIIELKDLIAVAIERVKDGRE